MGKLKINRHKNFTVLSNEVLQDKELSLKAKGMIAMMYSLPDDWNFSTRGLCALSTDGESSIRSTLHELEDCGYLKRTKVKDENGYFDVIYDIYDTRQIAPCVENPCVENPHKEKPHEENAHNIKELNNKEINNKEINNTNTNTIDNINVIDEYDEPICASVSVNELIDFFDTFEIKNVSDQKKIIKYLNNGMSFEVVKNGLNIPFERNTMQYDFESDQAPIKEPVSYGMAILEKWDAFNVKTLDDVKKYNRINKNRSKMIS